MLTTRGRNTINIRFLIMCLIYQVSRNMEGNVLTDLPLRDEVPVCPLHDQDVGGVQSNPHLDQGQSER